MAIQWLTEGNSMFFQQYTGVLTEKDCEKLKKDFKKNDVHAFHRLSYNDFSRAVLSVWPQIFIISWQANPAKKQKVQDRCVWLLRNQTRWFYVKTIRTKGLAAWVPLLGKVYVFVDKLGSKPSEREKKRREKIQNETKSWRLRVVKKVKRTRSCKGN
jgi:hypothetical protein